MQYLSKIENIGKCYIWNNDLFLFKKNGTLQRFDKNTIWEYQANTQYFALKLNNELLCIFTQFKRIVLINILTGQVHSEKELLFKPLKIKQEKIFGCHLTRVNEENHFFCGTLDKYLSEKQLFSTHKYIPIYLDIQRCYCQFGNNEIATYNISNGIKIWKEEFRHKIQKIDVWRDSIVLVYTNEDNVSTIYALDSLTGLCLWQNDEIASNFQIQNNQIYFFRKEAFYCIDVRDGNIAYSYNLFAKFTENSFDETTNMLVKGNYVYFSGIMDCIISMWELETGNLVWHHRLYPREQTGRKTDGYNLLEAVQISGNKLYQLDSGGNLYVFESKIPLEVDDDQ